MTSLTDAYEGRVGAVASRKRRLLGVLLFGLGAGLVVGGIVLTTTGAAESLDLGLYEAREIAGILAGLGVPAVLVGAFAVLPAGRATSAAAAIGASVAVFGVALFAHVYPYRWIGAADPSPGLTLMTTVVYFLGTTVTAWCLFVGVATFKTRKDPGGTARMEVTESGTIRLLEEPRSTRGLGGIGFFGSTPDGDVETQTNRPEHGQTGTQTNRHEQREAQSQPASDGGATTAAADDDAFLDAVTVRGQPDKYCGNCEHFSYVRTDEGIAPHCGLHAEYMDDMDACEQWSANR